MKIKAKWVNVFKIWGWGLKTRKPKVEKKLRPDQKWEIKIILIDFLGGIGSSDTS